MKGIDLALAGVAAFLLVFVAGCDGDEGGPEEDGRNLPAPDGDEPPPNGGPDEPPIPEGVDPESIGKPDGRGKGTVVGFLASPKTRLVQGVVYIEYMEGTFELPEENPVMDQRNVTFIPHVLPVLKGSTVDFPNNDTVRHSVYAEEGSANMYNLGQYAPEVTMRRKHENVGVTHLLCTIHEEMSAFIIAYQNPYFAVTEKRTGRFEIQDVPSGAYRLTFFHESLEPRTVIMVVEPDKETSVEFTDLE